MARKAVTAERMKALDRLAMDKYGIPSLLLMENAGRAVAEEALKRTARDKKGRARIAAICGKGNNGGDGMVACRYLFNKDKDVTAYIAGSASSIKGINALQYKILKRLGVPIKHVKDRKGLMSFKKLGRPDIIIDALFGIGFKGEARSLYKDAIESINSTSAYVISVDVPSCLDATTGRIGSSCVKADVTLTMGLPKTGFYKKGARAYTGRIRVVDIGMPKQLKEAAI